MASQSRKYSLLARSDHDDDVEIGGYDSEDAPLATDSEDELTGPSTIEIDAQQGRFPYCLVWTPIPLLTYKTTLSFINFAIVGWRVACYT
jgi:hypothetical protein